MTLIVVSDLHVGLGDAFDIFGGAAKAVLFADFLEWVTPPGPMELVLAGDTLDFLQLRPWVTGHDAALAKMQLLARTRMPLWAALGAFLERPEHKITVLTGNHDPELAWPDVWAVFRDAILVHAPGATNRLTLCPAPAGYRVGPALIHHGHTVDSQCACGDPTLPGFRYPPGTDFVNKVVNPFKTKYRFVDLLYPEMPALPLLLMALDPKACLQTFPAALRLSLGGFMGVGEDMAVQLATAALQALPYWQGNDPQDDPYARDAADLMGSGVQVVLCGHTHESRMLDVPGGVYVNTGAWADRLDLPLASDHDTIARWVRSLADNTFRQTCYPTYAVITDNVVQLCHWTGQGVELLDRRVLEAS